MERHTVDCIKGARGAHPRSGVNNKAVVPVHCVFFLLEGRWRLLLISGDKVGDQYAAGESGFRWIGGVRRQMGPRFSTEGAFDRYNPSSRGTCATSTDLIEIQCCACSEIRLSGCNLCSVITSWNWPANQGQPDRGPEHVVRGFLPVLPD